MTDVHDLRTRIGLFVATCGYLGFAPVAPGTFGSAAGLAAYYLLDLTGSAAIYGLVTAGLFALGIWSGTAAERALGGTDPSHFTVVAASNGCQGIVLAPGGTCTIVLSFAPAREMLCRWPAY